MSTNQRQVYTDTVKVRVYLEGVLFPYVKSVTVTESEGTVSAQIEVPPSIALRPDELAGMMCHIFYANKRVLALRGDAGDTEAPLGEGWPILFQGEMAGESVNTSVQSEGVVLTFTSHARHFEQTQLYFYDTSRQVNTLDLYKQVTFSGNTKINLESSGTPLDKKTQILTTMTRRIGELADDEDRNIAFTSTVLELLRSAGDQHATFGYFDKKLRLSQRFAAYVDPDVKNILKLTTLKSLIEQRAQGLPSFASLMQLLDIPTSMMKYNWNQLAQPIRRPKRLSKTSNRTEDASDIARKVRTASQQLANNVTPESTSISTVLGTVNIPKDYLPVTQGSGASATGYTELGTFINDVFVEYDALTEDIPEGDQERMLLIAFQEQVNLYKVPTVGAIAERQKKEKAQDSGAGTDEILDGDVTKDDDGGDKNQDLLEYEQRSLTERDELNEFTITPNMEFSHPPCCNVLFPASFSTYGMSRNHLQEPTRLYGRVDIMPSSQDSAGNAIEWYIAPLAQAYHFLDGSNLARFSEEYAKFINELPNQIVEEEK